MLISRIQQMLMATAWSLSAAAGPLRLKQGGEL